MIFQNGAVLQVLKSVVLFIAVKVIGFMVLLAWSNECLHNQMVNKRPPTSAASARENDKQISAIMILRFKDSVNRRSRTVGHVSNPSKIRDFVDTFKPCNWFPLFRIHGPIISLQR